jgi:hypothetical protein
MSMLGPSIPAGASNITGAGASTQAAAPPTIAASSGAHNQAAAVHNMTASTGAATQGSTSAGAAAIARPNLPNTYDHYTLKDLERDPILFASAMIQSIEFHKILNHQANIMARRMMATPSPSSGLSHTGVIL